MMKYNIAEMARLNGMSEQDYTDQICKNFIALMESKMEDTELKTASMFKFGGFTVITSKQETTSEIPNEPSIREG